MRIPHFTKADPIGWAGCQYCNRQLFCRLPAGSPCIALDCTGDKNIKKKGMEYRKLLPSNCLRYFSGILLCPTDKYPPVCGRWGLSLSQLSLGFIPESQLSNLSKHDRIKRVTISSGWTLFKRRPFAAWVLEGSCCIQWWEGGPGAQPNSSLHILPWSVLKVSGLLFSFLPSPSWESSTCSLMLLDHTADRGRECKISPYILLLCTAWNHLTPCTFILLLAAAWKQIPAFLWSSRGNSWLQR